MDRNPKWRQDTPQQQIAAISGSIHGDISNILGGIYGEIPEELQVVLNRIKDNQTQIQQIARFHLSDFDWRS